MLKTFFASQAEYEHYHSPGQTRARADQARLATERAVTAAHQAFFSGDQAQAQQILFDAGLDDDGIAYYIDCWGDERH